MVKLPVEILDNGSHLSSAINDNYAANEVTQYDKTQSA